MAYRTIDGRFWVDPDVRRLQPQTRFVFLYLITSPYAHVGGIYYLPVESAVVELGASHDRLFAALDTLCASGFIEWDKERSIVWVRNMLRYQGRGEKTERAVAIKLSELQGSRLVAQFLAAYPDVRKRLNPMGHRSAKQTPTVPKTSAQDAPSDNDTPSEGASGVGTQDQDTDQERGSCTKTEPKTQAAAPNGSLSRLPDRDPEPEARMGHRNGPKGSDPAADLRALWRSDRPAVRTAKPDDDLDAEIASRLDHDREQAIAAEQQRRRLVGLPPLEDTP